MQINHVTVRSPRIQSPLTLALVPDFHDGDVDRTLAACRGADAILIAGDLVNRHARNKSGFEYAVAFLRRAPEIAPTFYAIGNHERLLPYHDEYWPHVEASDVTVLDDAFVAFGGIVIGGLSSREEVDASWLPEMAARGEFRLLMCHHPEYFEPHIAPHDIDLTVAGHCHGGQVRIGKQGIFSPGQGLFPKLTSGFYFNHRLLVSRGVTNAVWAPRIHCACEVIMLHLEVSSHA